MRTQCLNSEMNLCFMLCRGPESTALLHSSLGGVNESGTPELLKRAITQLEDSFRDSPEWRADAFASGSCRDVKRGRSQDVGLRTCPKCMVISNLTNGFIADLTRDHRTDKQSASRLLKAKRTLWC